MAKYRALTGLNYGNRRVEAGEIADDIPAKSIKWLREQGLIEQVDAAGIPTSEPVSSDEPAADASSDEGGE